jgi:threonine aldolase
MSMGFPDPRVMVSKETSSLEFLSDNCAPACPEVVDALLRANIGSEESYGYDNLSRRAQTLFSQIFDCHCEVFFVASGVAANGISLASLIRPYESAICTKHAHVLKDECGAVAFFSGGGGLLSPQGCEDKLDARKIDKLLNSRVDVHFQRPAAVSITQATELGTLYADHELKEVIGTAKERGLYVHVDGARLAHAAAALGTQLLPDIARFGADIVTFGASKNGGAFGEAIVVLNPTLTPNIVPRLKQTGHLIPKVRYLSAGWIGLLQDGVWLRNARLANSMARKLADRLKVIPNLHVIDPVEVNSVLITGEPGVVGRLRVNLHWKTYAFIKPGTLRLTCAWSTNEASVEKVAAAIANILR